MLKTNAINLCLRYIGETPLPSGTTIDSLDPQHEAVVINNILSEVSERVQGDGWWFNREDWVFQPDSTTSKINIPPSVLTFKTGDGNYIVRGNVLYDRDKTTYIFTTKVAASIIWNIDFDTLPTKAAYYISYVAAQEAQILFNGDSFIDKDLKEKIIKAYADLRKEELRQAKYNLISGARIADRTMNPKGV